jgi:hypothetical protein
MTLAFEKFGAAASLAQHSAQPALPCRSDQLESHEPKQA